MKRLTAFISVFITGMINSGTALSHPGHLITGNITEGQMHSFLHSEHLLVLLAIVVVFLVGKTIKKL
jgi:hydrogenase/urease accessory protein HupE